MDSIDRDVQSKNINNSGSKLVLSDINTNRSLNNNLIKLSEIPLKFRNKYN